MNLDWMDRAACKDDPEPDCWFPTKGSTTEAKRAVRVCFSCPVRSECLAWHMAIEEEPSGIVAGLTAKERKRMVMA